jgi:hypothetical protein
MRFSIAHAKKIRLKRIFYSGFRGIFGVSVGDGLPVPFDADFAGDS